MKVWQPSGKTGDSSLETHRYHYPAPSQTLLYQSFISLSSGYLHLGISLQSKDTSAICNATPTPSRIFKDSSRNELQESYKSILPPLPSCICSLNLPISLQSAIGLLPFLKRISDIFILNVHLFTLPFAWSSFSLGRNLSSASNSNRT